MEADGMRGGDTDMHSECSMHARYMSVSSLTSIGR